MERIFTIHVGTIKMRRILITLLIAAGSSPLALAQSFSWVHAMETHDNLYDIQREFEQCWSGQSPEKGQGYKQFQRWKNFWEPRLFPSGDWSEKNMSDYLNHIRTPQNSNARDGGNWTELGLWDWSSYSYNPGNGRINCVTTSPTDPNLYYVGTPTGGLWKGTGSGDWTPLTESIPTLGVSGIVVTDDNPPTLYIGTGDSDGYDSYSVGVLKSTDGGNSWNTTGLSFNLGQNRRCNRLMAKSGDFNTLFCATSSGLYKTVNGGATWYVVLNGNIKDLEFKPDNAEVMYASSNKFFISTDGGENWDAVSDIMPNTASTQRIAIAVTPANPEYIYLLYADNANNAFNGLYRSADAGTSWELRSDTPNLLGPDEDGAAVWGQAWYDMELAVSDNNPELVLVGGINIWESFNGGQSWALNAEWHWPGDGAVAYVHADIHHIEFENGVLFVGSDGGVYKSTNGGGIYTDISEGLGITQLYRLGVYAGNSSIVACGAQDNGSLLLSAGNWTHLRGGDGMETIIHPQDPNKIFASSQYGDINFSDDGGVNWSWSASGINEDGAWTTPFIMSPINPDILYAGFENVWRSTDGGGSWINISNFNNEILQSLALPMIDPNTLYAASYDNIYRTSDAGNTWTNVSFGLPNEAITSIAVDPMDAERVWVSLSGFEDGDKVFYSASGGQGWTNISGSLPNVPVNCIVFDSSTESGLYVGTDLGIYYRSEQLTDWEPFMDGLPNAIISELEIHPGDGKLFAATYGRGLWVSDLWQAPDAVPQAGMDIDRAYICAGETVNISDNSWGNAPGWTWTIEGGDPQVSDLETTEVYYDTPGVYDVSLTVSNSFGSSDYLCENCVVVWDSIGAPLPFSQNFDSNVEFDASGLFRNEDSFGNRWEITSDASYSGSQSLWLENVQLDIQNEYAVFTRPYNLMNIEDGLNAYFSFRYAYTTRDGESDDRLRLYLSTNCGQTWALKKQWTFDELITAPATLESFVPNTTQWGQKIYQVNADDWGPSVGFKLVFRNDHGNNIFLDDLNLWSAISNIEVLNPWTTLQVFPNPSSGMITLACKTQKQQKLTAQITDISGRLVHQSYFDLIPGSNRQNLDLKYLPQGIYTLTLFGEAGRTSRLIVRQP